MTSATQFLKVAVVVVLGIAASGCIVLPYGDGHHRRDRDDRDFAGSQHRQFDGRQLDQPPHQRRGD